MSTDNFRDGFEDDFDFMDEEEELEGSPRQNNPSSGRFLGMTATQRFVLAIMLFLMVCILSSFCLLVTNKISLPF